MRLQDKITRWYRRNTEEIRNIRRYVVYPVIAGVLVLGAGIGLYQLNQRQREAEIAKAVEIQARNETEERRYNDFIELQSEIKGLKRQKEAYEKEIIKLRKFRKDVESGKLSESQKNKEMIRRALENPIIGM